MGFRNDDFSVTLSGMQYIILIQNTKYRYTFSEKKVKVLLRDYVKYIVNIDHCQAILTFEVLSQMKWLMILQVIFTKYFSANSNQLLKYNTGPQYLFFFIKVYFLHHLKIYFVYILH